MIKKEKFKLVWQPLPLYFDACIMNKLQQLNFKKEQMNLIPEKYNRKYRKEINLLPSRRFSDVKFFLLKMKKIDKFRLNYHRCMIQPLVLNILKCSF